MSSYGVRSLTSSSHFLLTIYMNCFVTGDGDWKARQRIEPILSQDPVFDKSRIPFLTRTELYNRALAMTNRLHELQAVNKWSAEEANIAFKVVDEPLPIALHMAGP